MTSPIVTALTLRLTSTNLLKKVLELVRVESIHASFVISFELFCYFDATTF
jgi:hypothetical protein